MDEKVKRVVKTQFPKMKVLIVDDMSQNIKNNAYFLMEMGFDRNNIQTARDGLTGLVKLQTFKAELILTDWNMPLADGLKMVKKIRSFSNYRDIPIIMITAESEKDTQEAQSFVSAVLKKPYSMKDVEDQIYLAVARFMIKGRAGS